MNDSNPQGTDSLSLMDAAASLEDSTPQRGQVEDEGANQEVLEEAQALEETDTEETEEEETQEVEGELDEETEEDSEQEESEEDEEEQPELLTVKVDGQELEVTLDELKSGYSRLQDYTRKTQELANQRKEFEAEVQQIGQERQLYAQMLSKLQNELQGESEPDWETLRTQDPTNYAIAVADWQRKQQKLQYAQAEQQRLAELQQIEQQKQYAKHLEKANEELSQKISGWSDKEKGKVIKAQIKSALEREGFSAEEIAQAADPRAMVLAWKAAQFDQMMSKKATLKPEKPRTKTVKSGKPVGMGKTTDLKRAKTNFAQNGDIRSAVALLNLMEN